MLSPVLIYLCFIRADFLVKKVIHNVKDDSFDDNVERSDNLSNIIISKTDYGWIRPQPEDAQNGEKKEGEYSPVSDDNDL